MTWIEAAPMQIMIAAVNAAALCWGGATDLKRREIPNAVPVTLLVTGLLDTEGIVARLILLCAMAVILWAAGRVTRQTVPGGDTKLLCALAFSIGIMPLTAILFLTAAGVVLVGLIKRLPMDRHVPLCTYVAPAYLICRTVAAIVL